MYKCSKIVVVKQPQNETNAEWMKRMDKKLTMLEFITCEYIKMLETENQKLSAENRRLKAKLGEHN